MPTLKKHCQVLSLCLITLFSQISRADKHDSPDVVVTIKPLYGITSQIMDGVGKPVLLLPDYASPHTFQLKPSLRRALLQADLIIWVGPTLETFLSKPLENLHPRFGILTLSTLPGLQILPQRTGRDWPDVHVHEHEADHENHDHATDPHLWLSPTNAQLIAKAIADLLIKNDPSHAKQYAQNLEILQKRIDAVNQELKILLEPIKNRPFLVYHDAYQYFEKAYGLKGMGTIIINPNVPLSAKGLSEINQMIEKKHITCVFTETEFRDLTIAKALKNSAVHVVELDPLGAKQVADNHAYENTLLALGKAFQSCWMPQTVPNTTPKNKAAPSH